MKTETYDTPEAFMQALHGKPRQKRGRNTRPDLPVAGRAPSTGLTSLIAGKVRTWSLEMDVRFGYRLYQIGGVSTGWCIDEKAACDAAKELTQ